MSLQMPTCGCKVRITAGGFAGMPVEANQIDYCPMHAAAGDLMEVLEEVLQPLFGAFYTYFAERHEASDLTLWAQMDNANQVVHDAIVSIRSEAS